MNTFVSFRSDKFPPVEGEEELINPGLWGKRLAEYLAEKLKAEGFEAEAILPEDWGWLIPVKRQASGEQGFPLAVCCGHQCGGDDEFLCFTDPPTPVFRRFIRKIDATEELGRLVAALDRILAADPDIRDVAWSADGPA